MAETYKTGDPYRLLGKRLVFTNWFYVQPECGHDWYDENGARPSIMSERPANDGGIRWKPGRPNYGIKLVTCKAQRSGPVFNYEKPWEKNGLSATVIKDNGIYRAWCTTGMHFNKESSDNFFCYMESDNAMDWRRPDCGIIDYGGSKNNNLLSRENGWQIHPGGVFTDPSAPDPERYKWLNEEHYGVEAFEAYAKKRPGEIDAKSVREDAGSGIRASGPNKGLYIGVRGAVSPDGIHWTFLPDPLVMTHSDSHTTGYYDTVRKKYVGYFRDFMTGPQADNFPGAVRPDSWKRSVGRAETDDFREFPLPEVVLTPDIGWPPNCQVYTNTRTSVPGAPDHHLMFPAIWDTGDDTTFAALATSYNGIVWQYAPGGAVLETAEQGKWDGGCVFTYPELLELPNGDFALPYTGYNVNHKYPRGCCSRNMGYGLWPKGRLMGIAAEENGEFGTVAIIPPGEKLLVNAVTKRAGHILAEVCDINGNPLKGREFENCSYISGDCYRTQVAWSGYDSLGADGNQAVILRFRLRRAVIYGLEFL